MGRFPEGMQICHKCDAPGCVNPEHLFLGTQLDNMRDMHAKGRNHGKGAPGESNRNNKLTEVQVLEIRRLHADTGMTIAQLGRHFGVYYTAISKIVNGKTWAHLPHPPNRKPPIEAEKVSEGLREVLKTLRWKYDIPAIKLADWFRLSRGHVFEILKDGKKSAG